MPLLLSENLGVFYGGCQHTYKEDLETVRQLVELRSADDSETGNEVLRSKARSNGYFILRQALKRGYADVARVMLEFGADVNNDKINSKARANTPLHHAVSRRYKDIVKLLLRKGANVNARNKKLETPLHLAVGTMTADAAVSHRIVSNGSAPGDSSDDIDVDIVKLLLKFGANVNARKKIGSSPFETVIEKGCSEVIVAMLGYRAHVNGHDSEGESPLMKAVRSGNVDIVSLLLDKVALINARCYRFHYTALHYAISYEFDRIVEVLLSKPDIDLNCKTGEGKTPLHLSVQKRNMYYLASLLERGADVNVVDDSGRTLLHYAAVNGKYDHDQDDRDEDGSIVSALLARGVNVNAVDNEGKTALHLAAYSRCRVNFMLTLLEQKPEVNLQDVDGKTPLHYVTSCYSATFEGNMFWYLPTIYCINSFDDWNQSNIKNDHADSSLGRVVETPFKNVCVKPSYSLEKVVSVLIERGAKPNVKDKEGNTALHYAVSSGKDTDLVILLLTHGADVNAKNCEGMTALHAAASFCNAAHVFALLAYGADVNDTDDKACTALHHAIDSPSDVRDLINLLLTRGVDINAKNCNGMTALHYAVCRDEQKYGNLVTPLLMLGADVHSKNCAGVTALHLAASACRGNYACALLEHGAEVNMKDDAGNTALSHAAAYCGDRGDCVATLLNHGADVNSTNGDGNTALHIAARHSNDEVVSVLLEHGAEINHKDYAGNTALHHAARSASGVLLSLLNHGANISAENLVGDTALHIAVQNSCENVVSVLLAHGAYIDCRNRFGKTALYMASEKGDCDIVRILLEHGADVNITTNRDSNDTPLLCALKHLPPVYFHVCIDSNNCFLRTVSILGSHLVMLNALNMSLNETNLETLKYMPVSELQQFRTTCANEVVLLKSSILGNHSKLSCYDVLTLERNDLLIIIRNNVVSEFFSRGDFWRFPIFGKMFALQCMRAKERATLLHKTSFFLGNLFSIPPGICVTAISDYLSNRDLQTFVSACEGTDP